MFPFPPRCAHTLFLRPAVCFHRSLSPSRETTGKVRVHQLLLACCQVSLFFSFLFFPFLFSLFFLSLFFDDCVREKCTRLLPACREQRMKRSQEGETCITDRRMNEERKEEREKSDLERIDSSLFASNPFLVFFMIVFFQIASFFACCRIFSLCHLHSQILLYSSINLILKKSLSVAIIDEFYTFDLMEYKEPSAKLTLTLTLNLKIRQFSFFCIFQEIMFLTQIVLLKNSKKVNAAAACVLTATL